MPNRLLTFSILLFVSFAIHLQAQDSLATIYFYKQGKFPGSVQGYDIKNGDAVLGRIKSNSVVTYSAKPGVRFFTAALESESSIRLNVEAGRTYFVECGTEGGGVVATRPTFRQVPKAEARKELAKINAGIASAIPAMDAALVKAQAQAQDSLATVYFYRGGQVAGIAVFYNVKQGDKIIGRMGVNTVVKYRAKPGAQIFKATTEGGTSIHLNLDAGKTYFVECGLTAGALVGRPTFRQAFSDVARKKIESIDPTIAQSIPEYIAEVIQQSDTTRALQNLFHRKRKGGATRSIVFGTLGILSLISIAQSQPPPPPGVQNVDVSVDNTGAYLFMGFDIIMVITGVTQTSNYSSEKLEALLNNYRKGNPLPIKIKSKVKGKDFK